jgi:hypothetical protein
MAERRCTTCGALVSADAAWCGQCFASLVERPETPPAPPATLPVEVEPGSNEQASWTCPACSNPNPLEADACMVCGTPFAKLFEQPTDRVEVPPARAIKWSLLYPGLGHRLVGRSGEGLARGVLFTLALGMALLLLLGRAGRPLGPILGMLAGFGAVAVGISTFTAVEAGHLARGGDPFATPRQVAWAAAGLVILSLIFAVVIATTASGSGK